ncbi:hypothetical protein BDZ89DRAFT_435344 [Hymenopellis radicata]|nr:hypothetical protein BDZ89DRAFT_435344 [Hymenopellis radicata]
MLRRLRPRARGMDLHRLQVGSVLTSSVRATVVPSSTAMQDSGACMSVALAIRVPIRCVSPQVAALFDSLRRQPGRQRQTVLRCTGVCLLLRFEAPIL